MFTIGRRKESRNVDVNRLVAGLEEEFDLLRLKKHSEDLAHTEADLNQQVECLRESLKTRMRWRRALAIRLNIFWLKVRRESLAEKRKWYRSLEEDIKFSLRLANARTTNDL